MPPTQQEQINAVTKNNLPVVDETINSVSGSTFHYLEKNFTKVIIVLCITIALEVFAALSKIQNVDIFIAPLSIPFLAYIWVRSKVEDEFMQQFAQANNYTYSKLGTFGSGYLFSVGHSQSAKDQVSGNYNGYPIKLYLYSYTVGYGRDARTYLHTVFSLKFNTLMSDIILLDKGRWFGDYMIPSNKSVLKLEGDFNKYFSLYVPKGNEMEALEVFTPDVMAKLIDKARSLNLEICQNFLYIYSDGFVQTKDKLYAMYEFARYLTDELGPVLAGMKPSLEAMAEVKQEILSK